MSVQSADSRIQLVGNNSTVTPYPVPFLFFDNADLVVVETDEDGVDTTLALGTDYTVSGAGVETGGQIVTTAAIPATSAVTIYREVDQTQLVQYEENDRFPSSTQEFVADKLTMLTQQNNRATGLSLKVRESDGAKNPITVVPATIVGFGGDKQPRTYTPAQLAVWLNLTQQFFGMGTKTWLTDADRALAVPDFLGQVGVQLDDFSLWVADGTTAGDWSDPTPGIADGSITTVKLADGALSADTTGRAKMADSFITLAKIGAGIFTADSTGRGKFASGFVDSSLLASGAAQANLAVGSVVQSVFASYALNADISTAIPIDDTTPQNTEGVEIISLSITPTSSTNRLRFQFDGVAAIIDNRYSAALFQDSNVNAIAAAPSYAPNNVSPTPIRLVHDMAAGSTSSITFKIRVGPAWGTLRMNGSTSARFFNGLCKSTLVIEEIKA